MAKKKTGLSFDSICYFDQKCIAIDTSGVPWSIDPTDGTIRPAKLIVENDKQSAVKKKRK